MHSPLVCIQSHILLRHRTRSFCLCSLRNVLTFPRTMANNGRAIRAACQPFKGSTTSFKRHSDLPPSNPISPSPAPPPKKKKRQAKTRVDLGNRSLDAFGLRSRRLAGGDSRAVLCPAPGMRFALERRAVLLGSLKVKGPRNVEHPQTLESGQRVVCWNDHSVQWRFGLTFRASASMR